MPTIDIVQLIEIRDKENGR